VNDAKKNCKSEISNDGKQAYVNDGTLKVGPFGPSMTDGEFLFILPFPVFKFFILTNIVIFPDVFLCA
jgi:hypothetical protein